MIDLSQYDNEGKKEVFYNEEEEIISKEDSLSKAPQEILDEAEESENSKEEEESETSDNMNPAKNVIGYELRGDEDMGELLAQEEDEDNTKIDKVNQLLFCCQGIGKQAKNENGNFIYIKNEYCIPSLKDIHKFLRNDSKTTQMFKRVFLAWNIVENDLIPCLLQYEEDEKISQIILIIFVDLTEELDDEVDNRKELEFSLAKLVEIFIKENVIDLISRKLNSSTEEFNRMKNLREKYKQLELEEQKKKKEEKEKMQKEQEEKQNEKINEEKKEDNNNINDNNNNNDGDNKNEEKESKKNNEEEEKSDKEESEKEKKIDNNEENKRILLHKIANMEYKSKNLIELLFVLLKQITSITNTSDLVDSSKLISLLLTKFTYLKLFDALLYYISTFNDLESYPFTKEVLSPYLLSILYNLTRPFNPKSILSLSAKKVFNKHSTINENEGKELQRLAELEKQDFLKRKMLFSSRGQTYNYRVQINRPIDNSSYFVNNMNQIINKNSANYVKEKANTFKSQRHGARYRKKTIFKDKKIPKSVVISEIKMINDSKIKNYFSEKSSEITSDEFNSTIIEIKNFLINLMNNNSFNGIIDFYYYKFDKDYELEKYDVYNLVNIMSFFIEFNRLLNYNDIKDFKNNEKKNDFNMKRIGLCISSNMVNLMYNFLYTEIIKTEKDERKGFILFPLLNYLKQCVYALMDSYRFSKNNLNEENDSVNLTINVMLQDSLLTKDYSKILENFFSIYNEVYYPVEYLYDIIEFSEIYFSALEYFVQKRELKIKTLKAKKKKKKKYREIDEEKEILHQIEKEKKRKYKTEDLDENLNPIKKEENKFTINDNDDESNNSYGEYDSSDNDNSDDDKYTEIFRDINVNEESKCLVSYDIIDKIFSIFKNVSGALVDNFDLSKKLIELKDNKRGILKYISKLIQRIAIKSKCFWIFFNIEYLVLFNRLLNEPSFKDEPAYNNFKETIIKILNEYFTIIQKNKMLPVECLFRVEGSSLIEAIMNNYEYNDDNIGLSAGNENEHYYGGLERGRKKDKNNNNIINNEEKDDDYDVNDDLNNKDKEDSVEEHYYKPWENKLSDNNSNNNSKKKLIKKNNNRNIGEDIDLDIEEEKNKINWNESMDKKLIEYYFENIKDDKSNIDEIIENLKNNELKQFNVECSVNDIKHRLHKLRVRKGKNKAMKKFNKIYNIENTMDIEEEESSHIKSKKQKKIIKKNINADLIPGYLYKLSEKSNDANYRTNLFHCLESIIEQLNDFKKKIDILGDTESDLKCEIIPTTSNDMNILKDSDVKNILLSLGFYFNNDTEYMTLSKEKISDIDIIPESILIYKNIINENIDQDKDKEKERNKEKEKYVEIQKKKHNNSKRLKDYILTEDEVKKEMEKDMQKEMMNINEDDMIIVNKKKKKKLIKKNKEQLDSIKEEEEIDSIKKKDNNNKNIINDEEE